ncbi:MAG TPA: hypothetical protein P5332_11465 [Ignavibacteriales bacterium]|nr:hypothetical protein [Ignavibacteriales bacterium]
MMMLTTFLPVVANNLPKFIGSFHFYAVLFISSGLVMEPKVILNKNILASLLICLFLLVLFPLTIWKDMDDWNKKSLQFEFYYIIMSLIIYQYYKINKDKYFLAKIIKYIVIFVGITAIMTIIASNIDPMYARTLSGIGYKTEQESQYFKRLGGGTYPTANVIMSLIPMIIYFYKNNHLVTYSRITIIFYSILLFIALIRMQIFANILIGIIFTILSMQGRRNIRKSIIYIILLTFILLLIPKTKYAEMLIYLSSFFNNLSEVHFKLTDMAKYLITGEETTAIGGRAMRYPELLTTFIQSPILGDFYEHQKIYSGAGGHLYWMNKLATLGVIGFIIFLQLYYLNIKSQLRDISNIEFKLFYLLSIGSIIVYGLIKNIAGRETFFMLFFILPNLQYYHYNWHRNTAVQNNLQK